MCQWENMCDIHTPPHDDNQCTGENDESTEMCGPDAACGVSEVVSFALLPLIGPGDEVLVPTPSYSLWGNSVHIAGGTPVFYRCDELSDWYPDTEDIRKNITSRTKAIVVINPNNPTGALYPREILEEIVRIAEEHELLIFADEIYDSDGWAGTYFHRVPCPGSASPYSYFVGARQWI